MVVSRRGQHRLADPSAALGGGRDSLNSPERGMLDYSDPWSEIEDAGRRTGGLIGLRTDTAISNIDIEGLGFLNGVLDGIDLEPGALIRKLRDAISEALEDRPLFGELVEPITGRMQRGDGLAAHFRNSRRLWGDGLDLNLGDGEFNPGEVLHEFMRDRVAPTNQFRNLVSLWGNGIDLDSDPGVFDLGDIIEQFIENRLKPTGRLAELIDGLLPDFRIPILGQGRIANLVSDLGSANSNASNALGGVQSTWNRFWDGIFQTSGSTGKTVDDLQIAASSIAQSVVLAQESNITLAYLVNAPKNVPYWVSPNPLEDVAFPRANLRWEAIGVTSDGPSNSVDSSWGNQESDAYNEHTHYVSVGTAAPFNHIPGNRVALISIRATQNRIYNTAGFLTDGATPPPTVLMGLYAVDQTTGDAELIYDFGNVSSLIATGVSGGMFDTRVNTAYDIVVSEGDTLMLGLAPIGGSIEMGAAYSMNLTTPPGIYPKWLSSYIYGGATSGSLPATFTDSDITDRTGRRIWACLGQALAEDTTPLVFVENFNGSDTTNWKAASWNWWNAPSSSTGVTNSQAYENVPSGGIIFDTSYMSSRLVKTPLHSSDQSVDITIGSGWAAQAYGKSSTRAYIRCRANGSKGGCMHVDFDGTNARVRIATITAMTNHFGTIRATSTGPLAADPGDRFRIEAVGNVYTCYRLAVGTEDAVPIPGATWTDSGNVIPQVSTFRTVGFGTGGYRNGLGSGFRSASISQFVARDLVEEVPPPIDDSGDIPYTIPFTI